MRIVRVSAMTEQSNTMDSELMNRFAFRPLVSKTFTFIAGLLAGLYPPRWKRVANVLLFNDTSIYPSLELFLMLVLYPF